MNSNGLIPFLLCSLSKFLSLTILGFCSVENLHGSSQKLYVTNVSFLQNPVLWTNEASDTYELVQLVKADSSNKGRYLKRVVIYTDGIGAMNLELDGEASNQACNFGSSCTLIPFIKNRLIDEGFTSAHLRLVDSEGDVKINLISIITSDF